MKTIVFIISFALIVMQGYAGIGDEGSTSVYEANHGQLNVMVEGLTSDAGLLKVLLFNQENGFPSDEWKAVYALELDINEEGSSVVFESIPYGEYAIYVYHDENENGKLDKNWAGAAKEGYGYSNMENSKRVIPLFSQCMFTFDKDGSQLIINIVPVKKTPA